MADGQEIGIHNFPDGADIDRMLDQADEDHVLLMVEQLQAGLRRQDPGTVVLQVRADGPPEVLSRARMDGQTGGATLMGVTVAYPVTVLVQDGEEDLWRLWGKMTLVKQGIGTDDPSLQFDFDLAGSAPWEQ